MADITLGESGLGTSLQELLCSDDMQPGTELSYQLAKTILEWHPLGRKMTFGPIDIAMSQQREISVQSGPEDRLKKAFLDTWKRLSADRHINNVAGLARTYGMAAVVVGVKGMATNKPLTPQKLANGELFFNTLDPLNMAGSALMVQDPNAPDFQRPTVVSAAGEVYHPSRCCVMLNQQPIYLSYTPAAFSYSGRSVFQSALYPLKTFVQSMIADDMLVRKAGVLIAKLKQPGAAVNAQMMASAGYKRDVLKAAKTDNIVNIGLEEIIESLNLQHASEALTTGRKDALENIAAGADMPAAMLNNETFAAGFGEGTEDAKVVARYIDGRREWMQPIYDFFDRIVMLRAWTPEFYLAIQNDFREYRKVDFQVAFEDWRNNFTASWPSLLIEPESEKAKTEDVKLKSVIAALEVLLPQMDPENRAILIDWAANAFNQNKVLFPDPLVLDIEALRDYVPPAPMMAGEGEPSEPKPFAANT